MLIPIPPRTLGIPSELARSWRKTWAAQSASNLSKARALPLHILGLALQEQGIGHSVSTS